MLVTWIHPLILLEIFCESLSNCITKVLPPSARAHTHLSFASLHFRVLKVFFCAGVKCLDSERTQHVILVTLIEKNYLLTISAGVLKFLGCVSYITSITVPAVLHVWVLLTL